MSSVAFGYLGGGAINHPKRGEWRERDGGALLRVKYLHLIEERIAGGCDHCLVYYYGLSLLFFIIGAMRSSVP